MPQPLGHGVVVTEEADGVHYRLPIATAGRLAGLCFLMPFAAVVALLGYLTFVRLLDVANGNDPVAVAALLTALAWGGLVYGVWRLRRLMQLGWLLTFGHGSIRLRGGDLVHGFHCGGLRADELCPVADVKRFVVRPWHARPDGPRSSKGNLLAELTDGTVCELSSPLPLDDARAVAAHLAERCGLPTGGDVAAAPEVAEGLLFDPVPVCEPPAGTGIQVEHFDDGVTVTIPPLGVWRASPKMFAGGLLYVAVLTAMSVALLALETDKPVAADDFACTLAFAVGHWGLALGLVGTALSRGRRRGVFAVVGDRFSYIHKGLFARSQDSCPVADVADVRVTARVGDLEDRPVQVLRIFRASGQARELFAHRDPAELAWVAVVLRRALGLPLRE